MKKNIAISYHGQLSKVGDLTVSRLLPNRYIRTVGPFFFLDHIVPMQVNAGEAQIPDGSHAHPHRGIATFTYVFSGEFEHFDSIGNHGIVNSGGAQWMKAGNGIIHDENFSKNLQEKGGLVHGLQFWINLPSKNKAELPKYLGVQSENFPLIKLPGNSGELKVLIGEFEGKHSPVETYLRQFNYHLKLGAKSSYSFSTDPDFESAAFIPSKEVFINGSLYGNAELVVFEITGTEIMIENKAEDDLDIILFGGEAYTEPIIAEGPFVMNSQVEIAQAYRDYQSGKYGEISYN